MLNITFLVFSVSIVLDHKSKAEMDIRHLWILFYPFPLLLFILHSQERASDSPWGSLNTLLGCNITLMSLSISSAWRLMRSDGSHVSLLQWPKTHVGYFMCRCVFFKVMGTWWCHFRFEGSTVSLLEMHPFLCSNSSIFSSQYHHIFLFFFTFCLFVFLALSTNERWEEQWKRSDISRDI